MSQKKVKIKKVVNRITASLSIKYFIIICLIPLVSSCSGLQPKKNPANSHFSSEAWQQQFDWFQDQQDTDFLFYVRRFDKAEKLAKSAINKAKKFGENDPRLARSLTSLARIQIEKSKFKDAIESLNRSYKIKSAKFGMNNTDVADILSEIAYAQLQLGSIEEAKKSILQSIEIRKSVKDDFGDMDSNYIEGLIFKKENKLPEASSKLQKCIEIYSSEIKNPIESLSTDHLNRMKNCFQTYISIKKQSNPNANLAEMEKDLNSLTNWLAVLGQSGV